MERFKKIEYVIAQRHEEERENFLKALPLGDLRRYVKKITYVESTDNSRAVEVDATMGQLWKEIFVFPRAFEFSSSFFESVLFDHEGHHAIQEYHHPLKIIIRTLCSKVKREYIDQLFEIPAYLNQIDQIKEKKLRSEEVEILSEGLEENFYLIKDFSKKKRRCWKKDLAGVLCHSPLDDVVRTKFSL